MSDITVNNFKAFYEQIRPYLGAVHSGFTPIGTVISVMGTTAPLNYLACDGTVYNISDYTELAAYFNAQFGSSNFFGGNGTTTFAVPDLRGEFLRGTGTNSHANQGSGSNVGEHQDGTEHIDIYTWDNLIGILANNEQGNQTKKMDYSQSATKDYNIQTTGVNVVTRPQRGYFTSRPTNTSVLYCIASKNIFMDAGSNYSTEEQVVGTWIDGKPLYQKTVNCGALPNNAFKSIAHGINNLLKVTHINGYAHSGNIEIPIPRAGTASDFIDVYRESENIVIRTAMNYSGYTESYVTLQYTKTS